MTAGPTPNRTTTHRSTALADLAARPTARTTPTCRHRRHGTDGAADMRPVAHDLVRQM
jgi:hypothetical protein